MKKSYYQKVAFLGILLLILFIFQKYTSREKENFPVTFIAERANTIPLSDFNPNELNDQQWKNLGFSEKQVLTILNYKKIIGGQFTSKEQIKKCYAISEDKFLELEPYILLPANNQEAKAYSFRAPEKKSIIISKRFNPDHLSANDWIQIGFSDKQASAILKYKAYLGGSFISKEKFRECFIINDENYQKLAPYLILPEKTPAQRTEQKSKAKLQPFDPNTLDVNGWLSLGFSEKQAQVIVQYRDKNLNGYFKNSEDLKKCFVISTEKFEELKPYIRINPVISTDSKPRISQEKTDFSTVDLNSITFKQLLEFGLDEKSAGSIIGFRKKLGGFVNKQQILETYNIDRDQVQKLITTCPLNATGIAKYTLVTAPEEWLKSHPYFKYSADKIIFYRISHPDDKKIWSLLKVKPEYEARMKLYLK